MDGVARKFTLCGLAWFKSRCLLDASWRLIDILCFGPSGEVTQQTRQHDEGHK
jgi:hypothetical protein